MPFTTTKSAFWKGFWDSAPFIVVAAPFAVLFGVLATEAGLSVFETLSFSVVVIAGAAQFTALSLMEDGAPTAIVLASALAVNLRMAMYSASITPYLGDQPIWKRAFAAYFLVDQTYAVSIAKFEAEPKMPPAQRIAYFFGTVTPICPMWYVFTLVGALVGQQIPEAWALDFVIPIAFLALIAPMLRSSAHICAALVAIVVALSLAWLPYNLGLIVAGLAGRSAGAQTEGWVERRGHEGHTALDQHHRAGGGQLRHSVLLSGSGGGQTFCALGAAAFALYGGGDLASVGGTACGLARGDGWEFGWAQADGGGGHLFCGISQQERDLGDLRRGGDALWVALAVVAGGVPRRVHFTCTLARSVLRGFVALGLNTWKLGDLLHQIPRKKRHLNLLKSRYLAQNGRGRLRTKRIGHVAVALHERKRMFGHLWRHIKTLADNAVALFGIRRSV